MKKEVNQVLGCKSLWLSWERHRRSQNLAAKLGTHLYEFQSNAPRFIKHPIFAFRTLIILVTKRPQLLFVQNPSVVLTLLSIFLKPLFKYKLIVDAHNAGVYPFEGGQEKFAAIFPFLHRHADLTIVTNGVLADIVKENGGEVATLPDPLPEFQIVAPERPKIDKKFIVTYICSYASDEPYIEVFNSGALLPNSIEIYVTGNDRKLSADQRNLAQRSKIILTGFLTDENYLKQLCGSDCIMVLTEFDDCMVCGAYEAVAVGVPVILSDTPVLKWWFGKGAIFTKNTALSIVESMLNMRKNNVLLCKEINDSRSSMQDRWNIEFCVLLKLLSKLSV